MQYEYPLMTGYRWNALQKISLGLGIPMEDISILENSMHTFINFNNVELTTEQKTVLDDIMINNPCGIPANIGNTTFKVMDLWSMRETLFAEFGIKPTMWFEEGNEDGTGECYIYLQFPKLLNEIEKEQVLNAYANSMKE